MDLGLVDVEWADGEGGGLRKSVLEAVSRVRFESVLPVRRFTSYRGQRHFTGWYWAATTQSLVRFESWLERDRAMLLDHDRRVVGAGLPAVPGDMAGGETPGLAYAGLLRASGGRLG